MKCSDCKKEIAEDYLPSNFCKECVEEYVDKVHKEVGKAPLHPEFH